MCAGPDQAAPYCQVNLVDQVAVSRSAPGAWAAHAAERHHPLHHWQLDAHVSDRARKHMGSSDADAGRKMEPAPQQQAGIGRMFLSGAIAACIAEATTLPLDTAKVR